MAIETSFATFDGFEIVASMAKVRALSPPVTPGGTMVLPADTFKTFSATVGSPLGGNVVVVGATVVVVGAIVVVVVGGAFVVVVVAATVVVVVGGAFVVVVVAATVVDVVGGAFVVVVVAATVVDVVGGAFVVVVVAATVVDVVGGAFVVVVVAATVVGVVGGAFVVVVVAATVVDVVGGAFVVVVVAARVVDVVDGAVEGVVAAVVVVVRWGRGGRGLEIGGKVTVGRVCGVVLSSPVPSSPVPSSLPPSLRATDVAVVGRTPVGVAARVLTRLAAAGLAAGVFALAGPVALPDVVAWNPWLCVTATAGLADSRIPVADTRRRLVFCMSASLRMS
jgi:hypothetical protein